MYHKLLIFTKDEISCHIPYSLDQRLTTFNVSGWQAARANKWEIYKGCGSYDFSWWSVGCLTPALEHCLWIQVHLYPGHWYGYLHLATSRIQLFLTLDSYSEYGNTDQNLDPLPLLYYFIHPCHQQASRGNFCKFLFITHILFINHNGGIIKNIQQISYETIQTHQICSVHTIIIHRYLQYITRYDFINLQ